MHLDSVEWHEDMPQVKLRPSAPEGRFILGSGPNPRVGHFVVMYDVRRPDALAADVGDVPALRNYVRPIVEQPGTYQMIGSCTLLDGEHAVIQWFADRPIQEVDVPPG